MGKEMTRRGDQCKCPACGWRIDSEAYRCPKCSIYFCYKCRARVVKGDPQYQCADQSCNCYGKLLCAACTTMVDETKDFVRTRRVKDTGSYPQKDTEPHPKKKNINYNLGDTVESWGFGPRKIAQDSANEAFKTKRQAEDTKRQAENAERRKNAAKGQNGCVILIILLAGGIGMFLGWYFFGLNGLFIAGFISVVFVVLASENSGESRKKGVEQKYVTETFTVTETVAQHRCCIQCKHPVKNIS